MAKTGGPRCGSCYGGEGWARMDRKRLLTGAAAHPVLEMGGSSSGYGPNSTGVGSCGTRERSRNPASSLGLICLP